MEESLIGEDFIYASAHVMHLKVGRLVQKNDGGG